MLAQPALMQEQLAEIQRSFAAHSEWLLSFSETNSFAVQSDEIEVTLKNEKLHLSTLTTRGWQHFVITNWELSGGQLIFQTARKLLHPPLTLDFTPRTLIKNLQAETKAARLLKAGELAQIARKKFSNQAKIERVSLNQSNRRGKVGTIARILLTLPNARTIAVCGSVIEKVDAENLLSNAILWFTKFSDRRKMSELWLVVPEKSLENVRKLHALLKDGWHEQINVYRQRTSLAGGGEMPTDKDDFLELVVPLSLTDLWQEKPKKLIKPKALELSKTAEAILELAPEAIDVVRSKQGETLRFNGLPFARVRDMQGEERVLFGIDAKQKKALNETSLKEFSDLLDNLRYHRQAAAVDKRNAFYKAAPESWLESILRRDVSRLDPNLVLAPLYAQFRLSSKQGSLDLLAVRTDGQLVVIELKTAVDREHVFQAANYWRQIELHRRNGNFKRLKMFGEIPILDAPPLIYLVAPLMSFHRDFDILANSITPEIEIWRFDLNEDWRDEIRVSRRTNVSARQT